jgi:peptide-methionine (S)-S-oxide reductase
MRISAFLVVLLILTIGTPRVEGQTAPRFPNPTVDRPLAAASSQETAVFAGGCFWGVEAVFAHVKGVIDSVSGYSGGSSKEASYELVSSGATRHAETVKVTYDPSRISYGQLLKVFFAVAHDPTELNRQGPDVGPQYRSVIFANGEIQERIAKSYILQLDAAKQFRNKIATEVVPLQAFYPAEAYHQDYAERHPNDLYIMINDRPKVYELRREYSELYADGGRPARP